MKHHDIKRKTVTLTSDADTQTPLPEISLEQAITIGLIILVAVIFIALEIYLK